MQSASSQRDPLLINVSEAARRLGGGRDWVYELVRTGRLPAIRVGRRILVPIAALDAFVDREASTTGSEEMRDDLGGTSVDPLGYRGPQLEGSDMAEGEPA